MGKDVERDYFRILFASLRASKLKFLMPQYLIIAQDGSDENALERRMQTRPFHLAGAKALKANNRFIVGGATLDAEGKMNGSVMIVEFDNDAQMQEWYDNEPYITQGVWKNIEVKLFKVADV